MSADTFDVTTGSTDFEKKSWNQVSTHTPTSFAAMLKGPGAGRRGYMIGSMAGDSNKPRRLTREAIATLNAITIRFITETPPGSVRDRLEAMDLSTIVVAQPVATVWCKRDDALRFSPDAELGASKFLYATGFPESAVAALDIIHEEHKPEGVMIEVKLEAQVYETTLIVFLSKPVIQKDFKGVNLFRAHVTTAAAAVWGDAKLQARLPRCDLQPVVVTDGATVLLSEGLPLCVDDLDLDGVDLLPFGAVKLPPKTGSSSGAGGGGGAGAGARSGGKKPWPKLSNDPAKDTIFDDEQALVEALNRRGAWCAGNTGMTVIGELSERETSIMTPDQAKWFWAPYKLLVEDAKGNPKAISGFKVWSESPDRLFFEGTTCDPSLPIRQGKKFNQWRGFELTPKEATGPGVVKLEKMLDHIKHNICVDNTEYYEFALDWIADLFQNPAVKGSCAMVVLGERGAGKSTLGQWIQKMIGMFHSVELTDDDEVFGRFNERIARSVFVQLEEMSWKPGNPKGRKFRAMISAPTILMDQKFLAAHTVMSMARFYITSNEFHVIDAGAYERRFFVLNARNVIDGLTYGHTDIEEYFDDLKAAAESDDSEGLRALMYFLMHRDINSRLRFPPQTQGLKQQVVAGLSQAECWLHDALEAGEFENDAIGSEAMPVQWHWDKETFVPTPVLIHSFGRKVNTYGGKDPSMRAIRAVFEPFGSLRSGREATGERVYGYWVRPLHEVQAAFTARLGVTFEPDPATATTVGASLKTRAVG